MVRNRIWALTAALATLAAMVAVGVGIGATPAGAAVAVTELADVNPSRMTASGDLAYFRAFYAPLGDDLLWQSDGTVEGTHPVARTAGSYTIGSVIFNPRSLVDVNGTLYFSAGSGLFRTDGTAAGTELIADDVVADLLTPVGNQIFFKGLAWGDWSNPEIWVSDGEPGGTTQQVKEIHPTEGSFPLHLTASGGRLFFTATQDATRDRELWTSDGTAGGTFRVLDIHPDRSSDPEELTDVNGTLFFRALDPDHGDELWKSDGTAAGTSLVEDLWTGVNSFGSPWSSRPSELTAFDGLLFFTASTSFSDDGVWISDGTAAGTERIHSVRSPTSFTSVGTTLFFAAFESSIGQELWKTDGTAAGTQLVKDIFPGTASSTPRVLAAVGTDLFFGANEGIHGQELWTSDGMASGTALAADINPGSASSQPFQLIGADGTAFFRADDGAGFGLWAAQVGPTNVPPTVDAGTATAAGEGTPITLDATVDDTDGDPLTTAWTVDSAMCSFGDASAVDTNVTCADDGSFTTTLTVSDGVNSPVTDNLTLTVSNAHPVAATTEPAQDSVHPVGGTLDLSVSFSDPGTADTHTCSIDWGDGTAAEAGTVTETDGAGTCTASHTYGTADLYTISTTVTDDDAGTDTTTVDIVVTDPSGSVSGGGAIESPPAAYTPEDPTDADVTGTARFRFVSRYKRGATTPTGTTRFVFRAADLQFESSVYDWLVVGGPQAQFKGSGSINGQPGYGFLVTASDEAVGGSGDDDTFRIKIWYEADETVVYDNGANTPILRGQIIIRS